MAALTQALAPARDWRASRSALASPSRILDGERFTLGRSERVTRVREAFYALKPAPIPPSATSDQLPEQTNNGHL